MELHTTRLEMNSGQGFFWAFSLYDNIIFQNMVEYNLQKGIRKVMGKVIFCKGSQANVSE